MMTTLRALVIAFSMYSQIPMPQFTWQDKEMKYAFCFFPWVGAAIGGCSGGGSAENFRLEMWHLP
jgi:adenosylcobinamide-GDP ribazoletransferase